MISDRFLGYSTNIRVDLLWEYLIHHPLFQFWPLTWLARVQTFLRPLNFWFRNISSIRTYEEEMLWVFDCSQCMINTRQTYHHSEYHQMQPRNLSSSSMLSYCLCTRINRPLKSLNVDKTDKIAISVLPVMFDNTVRASKYKPVAYAEPSASLSLHPDKAISLLATT